MFLKAEDSLSEKLQREEEKNDSLNGAMNGIDEFQCLREEAELCDRKQSTFNTKEEIQLHWIMHSNPSWDSSSQRICLKMSYLPESFLWFTGDATRWPFSGRST